MQALAALLAIAEEAAKACTPARVQTVLRYKVALSSWYLHHSPFGRVEPKRGEGSVWALPGRYRAAPSRKRESSMLGLQRLENPSPPGELGEMGAQTGSPLDEAALDTKIPY